jgi:hypothetical protein
VEEDFTFMTAVKIMECMAKGQMDLQTLADEFTGSRHVD